MISGFRIGWADRLAASASFAILLAGAPAMAQADPNAAWRQANQLGEFATAKPDWAAIEAAARKEGKVVVYTVSSRMNRLAAEFGKRYGIEVVPHDLSSDQQVEKLAREQKANIFAVDVLYNNEGPVMLAELMPKNMVVNFVPDNVAGVLEPYEQAPLLTHRWSSRILFYNSNAHPSGPPIDNLWDLTKPEWRGRFQMPDPMESAVQAAFIQTILNNPEAMAKAYEQEFGKPIVLSDQVRRAARGLQGVDGPNASLEWLRQVLANRPVFVGSTNRIFENVAAVGQQAPPVGIVTFSKLRDAVPGKLEAAPASGVKPFFGVAYPTAIVIANRAPNPNAAKLLVRFMMEREGFAPWNVIGDYAARSDVEAEQAVQFKKPIFAESGLRPIDAKQVYETKYSFLQLYLALRP